MPRYEITDTFARRPDPALVGWVSVSPDGRVTLEAAPPGHGDSSMDRSFDGWEQHDAENKLGRMATALRWGGIPRGGPWRAHLVAREVPEGQGGGGMLWEQYEGPLGRGPALGSPSN